MNDKNFKEYSRIVLSMADLCEEGRMTSPKTFKSLHIWYLYRQAFYGFMDHLDWSKCCKVSERAQVEYQKIHPSGDIRLKKWADQPEFDEGRQRGKFHFEHVFTGSMFRDAVDLLNGTERTPEKVMQIIQDNFCVAWILKEENKLLPQSKRGADLQAALVVYEKCGIRLL
jgi:hypothetical protein